MHVMGYWPFDGTAGLSFLRKLLLAPEKALTPLLRNSLERYWDICERARSGVDRVQLEPENFQVFVEAEGGIEEAKRAYGVWEENGRYWMREATFEEADRTFVACTVLFCASGGVITGDIYGDSCTDIHRCASRIATEQLESLADLALNAVSALKRVGDLVVDRSPFDQRRMVIELDRFAARFGEIKGSDTGD